MKVYFKILKYYFCISLFHDFPHCDFLMILYKKLNDSQRADYDQIVIILAPIETAPLKLIHAKLHTFQIERVMSNFSPHKSFLPKKNIKTELSFFIFQVRQWPHNLSFLFACLTCTVGMFSISRFAILTIDLGGKINIL